MSRLAQGISGALAGRSLVENGSVLRSHRVTGRMAVDPPGFRLATIYLADIPSSALLANPGFSEGQGGPTPCRMVSS